jgi:acyl carrier protein
MASEVEVVLSEYIRNEIMKRPNYVLGLDDPLISSGLIDSFHLVDMAVFIEEQFGARIDDTELNADVFNSLNQLGDLIRSRQRI